MTDPAPPADRAAADRAEDPAGAPPSPAETPRLIRAERAQLFAAYRVLTVTAGEAFYVDALSEAPPKAYWRQRDPSRPADAPLGGPHFDGELHGFFLFLPGADRPRLGAPMAERLDYLAAHHAKQTRAGARTPLGVTQPMRRDAVGVYLPFLADAPLPPEVAPPTAPGVESHFVIAGSVVEHVVVHIEAVRRGIPGRRLDLDETVALVRGRILRLRAANALVDAAAPVASRRRFSL